jgi:hypothetical protein
MSRQAKRWRIRTAFGAIDDYANFVSGFNVEYLVIGGGGAGASTPGMDAAGGGGAGGYRTNVAGQLSGRNTSAESSLLALFSVAYSIQVGVGGISGAAEGVGGYRIGGAGGASTFNTITAIGGAGGAPIQSTPPTGGSGGGGAVFAASYPTISITQAGGNGAAAQGFNGGSASNNVTFVDNSDGLTKNDPTYTCGGGGGGAGAAGGNGNNAVAGAGGAGISSNITGTAIVRAGGGGGTGGNSRVAPSTSLWGASGGSGGGGTGGIANQVSPFSAYVLATAGQNNTGGGGGSTHTWAINGTWTAAAKRGGHGVVILRYPAVYTLTLSSSTISVSTATINISGVDYKVSTFTLAAGATASGTGTVTWS